MTVCGGVWDSRLFRSLFELSFLPFFISSNAAASDVASHHALCVVRKIDRGLLAERKRSNLKYDEGIGSNFKQLWVTQITEKRYTVLN
jgi:hypothetical protein